MKIQELRIGNWYLSTKFQIPVICEMGDMYEIYMRADGSADYTVDDIFQPIPLTEEWLKKFGFKQTDEGAGFVAFHFWTNLIGEDRLYLRHYVMGGFIWGFNHFEELGQPIDIEYVHQLQNLYFALCGEELTVKS